MKITYDKTADALYIRLIPGTPECRTVLVSDDVALDFAADDQLAGVEVLSASRYFEKPDEPSISLEILPPPVIPA